MLSCYYADMRMAESLEIRLLRMAVPPAKRDAKRRELLKIKIKALFYANNESTGTGASTPRWSAAASRPATRPSAI